MGIENIEGKQSYDLEQAVTEALKEGGELLPEGHLEHPAAGDLRGLARSFSMAGLDDLRNPSFLAEQFDRAAVAPGSPEHGFFMGLIDQLTNGSEQGMVESTGSSETEPVGLEEAFKHFDEEAFKSGLDEAETVDELIAAFETHSFPIEKRGEVRDAIPVVLEEDGESSPAWLPSENFRKNMKQLEADLRAGRHIGNEKYYEDPASLYWYPAYLHEAVNRVMEKVKPEGGEVV